MERTDECIVTKFYSSITGKESCAAVVLVEVALCRECYGRLKYRAN